MGKVESDEKALLDESKDVSIDVTESPPPYHQIERGQRIYPTNRAYNWICDRAIPTHQPESERSDRRQRWSACSYLLLAIPLVLLMSLGVYLLMTMMFWCPTCSHHKIQHHENKIKSQLEILRREMDPDVDLTPQVPAFKSDFTQNKKEEIPEIDEQPHIFKRIFFFFHPSQDEQQEETVGKESSKGPETIINELPEGMQNLEEVSEAPIGFPAQIMQSMMGMAHNMFSGVHDLFTFTPNEDAKEKPKEKQPQSSHTHKTIKIEENGKEVKNLDNLIDAAVEQKENQAKQAAEKPEGEHPHKTIKVEENGHVVKNVDKLIDAALEEKANESSAKDVKSVADLFKEVVDKETDPFNF